jgi:RNA polymerase sigma-70 factor (ECF subfamily)
VSSTADELADVIAACRAGDRQAQRSLYDRFHRTVYRLAVRMVGRAEAADVAQEVFLRVFARIGSYRGTAAFATWLYRIAVNECLRYRGRRRPRLERLADEPACEAAGPDRTLEQADLLERALAGIDQRLRVVFLLREVDGLSYQQIAEVLGSAPGTVASQLNRARADLQAFLRRVEG